MFAYSVERLLYQLMESGYPALDPLVIMPEGYITVQKKFLEKQDWSELFYLLHSNR